MSDSNQTIDYWLPESIQMDEFGLDNIDANALMDGIKFSDIIVMDEHGHPITAENPNLASVLPVDTQQRGPPARNAVDTQFNFTVEINSTQTNKRKYLYSHRLNRIYVDRECDFSVLFNWNGALAAAMRVRACVVFEDEAQAQKRPECCLQHVPQDVDKHIGLNVLHSSRPKGTHGVEYHGAAVAPDSWLSTVVALAKPGPHALAHAYKFVCKSSCSSGINRRAIAIIFTLEDNQGKVFGRQMVGARVCSCPRRDMSKDEEAEGVYKAGKKRVPANMMQPKPAKKKKLEPVKVEPTEIDERVISLPPLDVVGVGTGIAALEVMVAMTQQGLAFHRNDPQAVEKYEKVLEKLQQTLQELRNKSPTV